MDFRSCLYLYFDSASAVAEPVAPAFAVPVALQVVAVPVQAVDAAVVAGPEWRMKQLMAN